MARPGGVFRERDAVVRSTGLLLVALVAMSLAGAQAKQAPPVAWPPALTGLTQSLPAEHPVDRNGTAWVSRLTGRVQSAFTLAEGPYAGDPETVARTFLAQWTDRLGLRADLGDLRLERVQGAPGGWHVRFLQTKDGADVWRAELVVSLDAPGTRVTAVQSNYDPMLAAAPGMPAAALTPDGALYAAAAAFGLPHDPTDYAGLRATLTGEPRMDLQVVRNGDVPGGAAHLAYRVLLSTQEPVGEWTVRVDATTDAILGVEDNRVFVDGSGMAFDPDPLTTAEVNYGGNYSDNNDGDTAELNAERFTRPLYGLSYSGGVYNLNGPFVHITNFENPPDPPVTSNDPDGFVYTRNQQGFEDVHAYYQIDTSQRHIQALGFLNIQNGSITVDTHGLNGDDNSYYQSGSNRIAYGEGGVDDAEDTDVVIHEYGHAIQYGTVPGWGGGQEGAMGEGFGDYWAGSYSASISAFHENWVFNWDGHNPFWAGRVLDSTLHYPEGLNGQVHHDGQIWSAPLFQAWHELGRTVMDRLVLKSHFYLGTYATMTQGAAAIMQGDRDLHDGLHAGTLETFFTARGFFAAGDYQVPVVTHTPLPDPGGPGPYYIRCAVQTTRPLVAGSVKVVYGVNGAFDHETVLLPMSGSLTGYEGWMVSMGGDVVVNYYIKAKNADGWQGTAPRGAEYTHYEFTATGASSADDADARIARPSLTLGSNPLLIGGGIRLGLPAARPGSLAIYDIAGRRVRTLAAGTLAAGSKEYAWDGRNDAGQPVAPGLYFARLTAGEEVLVRKVILSR
jgi:hypothetical protein